MNYLSVSRFFILSLFLHFCFYSSAQVWSEDFSGYPNGTMNDAPNWTTNFGDCDDGASINAGDNYWGTTDTGTETYFEVNDIEGFNCTVVGSGMGGNNQNTILFNTIDISSFGCVYVSVDMEGDGNFECDPPYDTAPTDDPVGFYDSHDQFVVEYSLDSGPWTLAENNGYVCESNTFAPLTITSTDLLGSTLQVRITLGNQATAEFYYIYEVAIYESTNASNDFDNPGDQETCDSYTLPPITGSGLTGNEAYFTGPGGTGTEYAPGDDFTGTGVTTLYIFDPTTCSDEESLMVTIHDSPSFDVPVSTFNLCYTFIPSLSWTENSDEIFDEITIGDPSLTVDLFYDAAGTNPIDITTSGGIAIFIATILGGSPPYTIYANVSNANCTGEIFPITLNIEEFPNIDDGELEACPNSGMATFDLTDADDQFDNGGTYTVSYHSTLPDAQNGDNPVTNPVTVSMNTTYFVRVLTDGAGCPGTAELDLVLTSGPVAEDASLEACDDGGGQGTFDLTSVSSTVLDGQSGTVSFYTDMAAMPGDLINPDDAYVSGPGTVYAVISASGCTSEPSEITLTLLDFDESEASISVSPTSLCGSGDVSMTLNAPASPAGSYTFNVSYGPEGGPYTTTDFTGMTGDMPLTANVDENYEFILNSVSTSGSLICSQVSSQGTILVTVDGSPSAVPTDLTVCNNGSGQGDFDLSSLDDIVNDGSGLDVVWYEDPTPATPIADPTSFITPPVTVYAVVDGGAGCMSAPVPVDLMLEEVPEISISATPDNGCGETDVTITFNIPNGEILDIEFQLSPGAMQFDYENITDGHTEDFTLSQFTLFEVLFVTSELGCEFSPAANAQVDIASPPAVSTAALSTCSSTATAIFDLTDANEAVSGEIGATVLWFEDQDGNNSIGTPEMYESAGETVYAQVQDGGCLSELVEVVLTLEGGPTAIPASLDACDNGGGVGNFNLLDLDETVNDNTGLTVQWFEDMNATNPIGDPADFDSPATTVYANVVDGDCVSNTVAIDLNINDAPAANPAALEACDEGGGQATFDLTDVTNTVNDNVGANTINWFEDEDATISIGSPSNFSSSDGSVYATVFDGTCLSAVVEITLTVNEAPQANDDAIDNCNEGGGEATFDLTAIEDDINNTPGNTIDWFFDEDATNPIPDPSSTQTGPTTVHAVVSNANCTAIAMVELTVSDGVAAASADLSLCGNAFGEATFDLTSVSDEVNLNTGNNINWYENSNATILIADPENYTSAGETIYAVVDDGTCFSEITEINLEVNDAPVANETSIEGCDDGTGMVTYDLTSLDDFVNDNTGLTVEWFFDPEALDPIGTPDDFTTDLSAVYAIVIGNDCNSSPAQVILNIENGPNLDLSIDQEISCNSANDGALTLDVTGSAGFTFDWSDDDYDGLQNPTSVSPGFYSVTVTDGNGCTAEADIDIEEPDLLDISCAEGMAVSTSGGNDGEAEITITGGTSSYEIEWAGAANGTQAAFSEGVHTITGLVAGNYTLTVTDFNDCESTCSFTISEPGCNITVSLIKEDINCNGADNGTINVNSQNGNGTLDYDWSDDAFDGMSMLNNLPPGSYAVTITDESDCATSASIMITQPTVLDLSCAPINQQSANISIAGGTAPYTFNWTGPTNGSMNQANAGDFDITGLTQGTYNLTVTDDNNCTEICSFTIPNCTTSVSLFTTPILCNGGPTTITAMINEGVPPFEYDWSDDAFDGMSQLINVPAGSYSLTLTDGNDCQALAFAVIPQPDLLEINCNIISSPSAPGAADGEISIDIQGGTAGFTIDYTSTDANGMQVGVLGMNSILNLPAGNYTITVTDANDCSQECQLILGDPSCDLSIMLSGEDPNCFDAANGTLDLTINSSQVITFIDWNVDELDGTEDPQNLTSGTYAVTVTDAANCTATGSFTLNNPAQISVDCGQISPISTPNGNDGSISVVIADGVPGYQISWSGPVSGMDNLNMDGTYIIENLSAGLYVIQVTDMNGCMVTCNSTLIDPACDFSIQAVIEDVACNGDTTGSITLALMNGTADYIFDWSDDQYDSTGATGDLINIPAGNYDVTVTDAAGCLATQNIVISQAPVIDISCAVVNAPSPGMSDGNFQVDIISGPSAPFTIHYLNTTTGIDGMIPGILGANLIENVAEGTYLITVSNSIDCEVTCELILQDPTCNISLQFESMDETCEGQANGFVVVVPSGGQVPYTYNWSDLSVNDTITDLSDGLYSVTVTDNQGCQQIGSVTINTLFNRNTLTVGDGGTICADECYELAVNISDPLPATLTYGLTDQNNNTTILTEVISENNSNILLCPLQLGLSAGDFTVTVTQIETADCTFSYDETRDFIYLPPPTGQFMQTICASDTITVGGEDFYMGNASGDVLLPDASENGCDSLVNVAIDFYPEFNSDFNTTICSNDTLMIGGSLFHQANTAETVVFQTTDGCDSLVNVSIDFFPAIITDINQTICQTDTFFYANEAYYLGNETGEIILENMATNGCDSTIQISIDFFDPILHFIEENICAGDSILVGNEWFHEDNLTGNVLLENTTANGCDSTVEVILTLLDHSEFDLTAAICPGDSVIVGNLSLMNAGIYTIVLENMAANGCDSIVNLDLSVLPVPEEDLNPILCMGDSLVINNQVFNEANPGGQVVLGGMAANGCDSIINVQLAFLPAAEGLYEDQLCMGESVTIGGQTFDMDTPMGMVLLENMSANGCDSTVMVDLTFLPNTLGSLDTTICFGASIQVGDVVFDASMPSGPVVLENMAANGCDSTVMVNVTFFEHQSASLTGDAVICNGETTMLTLSLSGSDEFTISISDGNSPPIVLPNAMDGDLIPVSPSQNSTYTIVAAASNENNCDVGFSGEAVISVSDLAVQANSTSVFGNFDVSCANTNDGSAEVVINGGLAPLLINWSTGNTNPQIDDLGVGTYTVTVTDDAGCIEESAVTLAGPSPIVVDAIGINTGCFGESNGLLSINTITGGNAPYEYSLDGEFFQSLTLPFNLVNQTAGNYELTVQDANDCSELTNLLIPEAEELVMELGDDVEIIAGDSVLLFPTTNFQPAQWIWTPKESLSQADTFFTYAAPLETTIYSLELTDENGCTVADIVRVFVNTDIPIYIPSAFSPDGDGINDNLYIFAGNGVQEIRQFQIFDRWGDQIFVDGPFQANDPNHGWDGNLNGQPMNPAVFVYFVEVLLSNGQTITLEGDFVLLR